MKAEEREVPGVDAWRKLEMPAPPTYLYETIEPQRATVSARYRFRWAAAGLACVLTAGVMMWPQRSAAAELQKVLDASAAKAFFELTLYTVGPDGKQVLFNRSWFHGKDSHSVFEDPPDDMSLIGMRTTLYRKDANVAETYQRTKPLKHYATLSLANFVNTSTADKVTKESARIWRGRSVDVFHVDSHFEDAQHVMRHSHCDVIVDAATQLPLQGHTGCPGLGPDTIWEYDFPKYDARLMQVQVPQGVPTYDIDQQRKDLMSGVLTPIAKTTVAGEEIDLRALVVDRDGLIEAVTSGGWTQPPTEEYWNHQMEVDGFPAKFPFDPPKGETNRGKSLSSMPSWIYPQPSAYQGLNLVHSSLMCAEKSLFTDHLTVRVPVWKRITTDVIPSDSLFLGWAVFRDVKPIWTANTVELLRPMNVSIFHDAAPARP